MKVTLLMAQTVDGKIAHGRDELIDWTSKEDKKFFVAETKRVGVVIMGSRTFKTFGRPLPGRRIIVMTRQAPSPTLRGEEKEGVVPGTVEFTNDAPRAILDRLAAEGHHDVILAGGPTINNLFIKENLIDEIKLSVEPRLFGSGLSLFEGVELNHELELVSTTSLTPSVLVLHYKIVTRNP